MKLAFQIAWRFLMSAKRQTLLIILGISVGVSVQVFIGSLITGLQNSLVDATIGSSSHITIVRGDDERFIDDYETIITTVQNQSDLFVVASPTFDMRGIAEVNEVKREIRLRGFDFTKANQIYGFNNKLVEGNLPTLANHIALGIGLKSELDIAVDSVVTIEIGNEIVTAIVTGFFDFNVAIINNTWAISTLQTTQTYASEIGKITSIETQISSVFEAETLAADLDNQLPNTLKTNNWMSENQELLSGLQGQSISSLMIQVFVLVSVVLGISSVLAITVMQKSKQIGILKAMGIQNKDASFVFLFEGLLLGFFGAIGGVLLGVGLSVSFTTFALGPDGNPVVPLTIEAGFIVLSSGIAVLASTIASLVPARKSSKLTVIEVIRNA